LTREPTRSFAQRFAGEIGGETSVVDSHDRQATSIHRDAVRDSERRPEAWRMNGDAAAIAMKIESFDGSLMLDDASKHSCLLRPCDECTAFRAEGRKH